MRSPDSDLFFPRGSELQEDKRNGYGYWSFMPQPAAPLNEALPELKAYGDFTEIPDIIKELIDSRAVLVAGAPGSGKSHLLRDIQTGAVLNNIPTFALTMHVNAGNKKGVENIKPALGEFRDKTEYTGGGLVILDNVDYVGYYSKRRSHGRASAYAQPAETLVKDLISDPNLVVLATAHDDGWREGKWKWQDELIDGPAQSILEAFPSRLEFDGKMALMGLAHILRERNIARAEGEPDISKGVAAHVMRLLHQSGRANFFHANHLQIDLFLKDPNAAIQKIEEARNAKRGKT
jgi:hypothetical protein